MRVLDRRRLSPTDGEDGWQGRVTVTSLRTILEVAQHRDLGTSPVDIAALAVKCVHAPHNADCMSVETRTGRYRPSYPSLCLGSAYIQIVAYM